MKRLNENVTISTMNSPVTKKYDNQKENVTISTVYSPGKKKYDNQKEIY
jgi:hypothetical protein